MFSMGYRRKRGSRAQPARAFLCSLRSRLLRGSTVCWCIRFHMPEAFCRARDDDMASVLKSGGHWRSMSLPCKCTPFPLPMSFLSANNVDFAPRLRIPQLSSSSLTNVAARAFLQAIRRASSHISRRRLGIPQQSASKSVLIRGLKTSPAHLGIAEYCCRMCSSIHLKRGLHNMRGDNWNYS